MSRTFLSLDVGEKRIGVAVAGSDVRIAVPLETIVLEGDVNAVDRIAHLVADEQADTLVIGYPRNQSGEVTAQTANVTAFAGQLEPLGIPIVFQDESLTSQLAEARLKLHSRPYDKGDIDAQAAAIILEDYLETRV